MSWRIAIMLPIMLLALGANSLAAIDPLTRRHLNELHEATGKVIQQVIFTEPSTPESLRQKFLGLQKLKFHASEIRRVIQWFHETQGDSRLDVALESLGKNSIRLVVTYKPRRRVTSIKIEGNSAISENVILPLLDIRDGAELDLGLVDGSAKKLAAYYFRQGYLQAEVTYKIQNDGEVVIRVEEGKPVLVGSVDVSEPSVVEDPAARRRYVRELLEAFGMHPGSRVERKRVDDGKQLVRAWLRDHDFLLAKEPQVEPSVDSNGNISLFLNIDFGPRIRFGFRGNSYFSYRELISFVADVKEISGGTDYVDAVRRKVLEIYKDAGYPNVSVTTEIREERARGIRYVSLIIEEGYRTRIAELKIEGVHSLSAEESRIKFESFASRLVQRGYYHEHGVAQGAELFTDYLKSQGYLSTKLEFTRVDFSDDRKQAFVTVLFSQGVQTQVHEVFVAGVNNIPNDKVMEILGLKKEKPFNIFAFEAGLVRLKEHYGELGYLDAKILNEGTDSLVKYSRDQTLVDINLKVEEGPLGHVGEIVVRGNKQTHARVILREMPFLSGDILTRPLLSEAEDNLRRLNLFASVIVRAVDRPDDSSKKDILILVEETIPGSFEVAPGFRNDLGLRLGLSVAYQNLGGWHRSVYAGAIINRRLEHYNFPEYNISFGFKEPYLANWPVTLTSNVNLLRRQFTSFDASTSKIVTGVNREFFSRKLNGFVEHGYERTRISNAKGLYGPLDEGLSFIGSITPGFILDTRNDPYNPVSGFISTNRFETASKFFGSSEKIGYIKISTYNSVYWELLDKIVLALGVNFGFERSNISNEAIPFIKLFRLGGVSSLRGYEDEAIEVDRQKTISGTLSMVNYRGELRIPIVGNFGSALFFDAGNLSVDSITPWKVRSSAGWGLRYNTPVGPVVLDVAYKLQTDPTVGDTTVKDASRLHYHFSIGSF